MTLTCCYAMVVTAASIFDYGYICQYYRIDPILRNQVFTFIALTPLYSQFPKANGIAILVCSERVRTLVSTKAKNIVLPAFRPVILSFVGAGLRAIRLLISLVIMIRLLT